MTATYETQPMDHCATLPIDNNPTFAEFQASRKWTDSIDRDYHGGESDASSDDYRHTPGFLYMDGACYVAMEDDGAWTAYEWGPDYLTSADLGIAERQQYDWAIEADHFN